ncbi:DUF6783 domain-containing protein [uncultured Robinsoniella sp.]
MSKDFKNSNTPKWGVQMAGINFHTGSGTLS